MNTRRLLCRALGIPALATALLVGAVAPAHATGVPPEEHCLTLDDAAVLCFTVGAVFTPTPTEPHTVAGVLTLTIGCRSDFIDGPVCGQPVVVPVPVDKTGVVRGNPTVEVKQILLIHVPKACFDDVCGPTFDLPVYAPIVTGSVATVWVAGKAVPIGMPSCLAECAIDPGAVTRMANQIAAVVNPLVAALGVEGDGISFE